VARELLKEAVLQITHNNKATWIRPKNHSRNKQPSNQASIEINDRDPDKNTDRFLIRNKP
jgi:hypothetical protein